MKKQLWDGKPWQAFKTFAILFSFTLNMVMLLVLLAMAPLILPIVKDIARPIVGGLNSSFVDMNGATIQRTIAVSDTIPVVLSVPLSTTTTVLVLENVPLNIPATFTLPDGGGLIKGQVALELPAQLALPVQLSLDVPISQTLPVQLAVEAVIPLDETELGVPFGRLQSIFDPLNALLNRLPSSNGELFERIMGSVNPVDPAAEPAGEAQSNSTD